MFNGNGSYWCSFVLEPVYSQSYILVQETFAFNVIPSLVFNSHDRAIQYNGAPTFRLCRARHLPKLIFFLSIFRSHQFHNTFNLILTCHWTAFGLIKPTNLMHTYCMQNNYYIFLFKTIFSFASFERFGEAWKKSKEHTNWLFNLVRHLWETRTDVRCSRVWVFSSQRTRRWSMRAYHCARHFVSLTMNR